MLKCTHNFDHAVAATCGVIIQIKCDHYWPDHESCSINGTMICDQLEVSLISQEETNYSTVSRFRLNERDV